MTSTPAIRVEQVSRRFGSRTVLDRVSLQAARGECVALFGPNGAGKTTLLRLLSLTLRRQGGRIEIDGLDAAREPQAIRGRIGVIGHQTRLYDDLTARENLEFFGSLYGVDAPGPRAAALLDHVGLGHRADEPVGTFSRGMRQRLAAARAIVHDPPVVLLDEPFSGLDLAAAATLRRTIEELRGRERSVLVVTHDLELGLALADRWIVLRRGRIVADGASADVEHAGFRDRYREMIERPARSPT